MGLNCSERDAGWTWIKQTIAQDTKSRLDIHLGE